ncbi:hypothetical protein G6F58_013371 [Rhizopus delemar]|nr:hypothetical protein G6F58_013371 [Rhizopus delemar]
MVAIQVRAQRAGVQAVVFSQPGGQLIGNVAVSGAVDFGAVTGGQDAASRTEPPNAERRPSSAGLSRSTGMDTRSRTETGADV